MTMYKRTATVAITLTAALWALAGTAYAGHSQVKITEVFTGSADPDSEYVELQMYADGENEFAAPNSAYLDFYNSPGTLVGSTSAFGVNPLDGNQRTVLAISPQADIEFTPPTPDLTFPNSNFLDPAGGAVCFASNPFNVLPFIDCVSYGIFTNVAGLPVGTAAPAPTATQSINRTIAPNCPTQLEAADDTNDSATDFSLGTPSPTPSTVGPNLPSCTPPQTPGPPGGGGTGPAPTGPTGQRAAALKKCKKKKSKKARKKCKKKAKKLPV